MSNSVSPKAQSIDTEIRSTLSDRPISSIESWDLSTHSVEQSSSQQPLPQMVSNLVPTVQRMPQQTVQQLDSFRLQAGQQSIRQNIATKNYSNPQQLSPEFAEKVQTIQSITGVERVSFIELLFLFYYKIFIIIFRQSLFVFFIFAMETLRMLSIPYIPIENAVKK
jgi:hypothetical protein